MSFQSFSDFLAMGGHGLYVWSAYGVTLLVLVLNVLHPLLNTRRYFRAQKQLLRRENASNVASDASCDQ